MTSEARTPEAVIKLCLAEAQSYRLTDSFGREVVARYILRCLKVLKADGQVTAEDAYRLLRNIDLGVFRDYEAEQHLGLVKDCSQVEALDVIP